ncbi:MAG: phosphate signaling complex protein PhoU [Rhodothermia bacterium]
MKKFENDLAALTKRVVEMGDLVASMIEMVTRALDTCQPEVLREVARREENVNRMQVEIDRESIRLLTVYSPVAGDLRLVFMVSRINSELERIGDQAINMGEYLQLLVSDDHAGAFSESPRMAKIVLKMFNDALSAFYSQDQAKAEAVIARDDVVDALNHEVLRRCLHGAQDDMAHAVAEILWARSLERIADQATNICEEVIYIVSGRDIRHRAMLDDQVGQAAQ